MGKRSSKRIFSQHDTYVSKDMLLDQPHPIKNAVGSFLETPFVGASWIGQILPIVLDDVTNFLLLPRM